MAESAGTVGAAQALHVSNLPWDVTTRDLYWLYTTMPGYQCGTLKYDSAGARSPIAFITFDSYQNAEVAMHASNGLPWEGGDPGAQRLKVALAKEASKGAARADGSITVNGSRPVAPPGYPGAAAAASPYGAAAAMAPGAAARYSPYPGADPAAYAAMAQAAYDPAAYAGAMQMSAARTKSVGTPSTTLYVHSGRPAPYEFTQHQIEGLFNRQAPLPQKVSVRGGRAWVKYITVEEATTAIAIYNGYVGPETDGGSIEISYARSETKDG